MKKVVIMAGEASGDQHAAHFVRQLKEKYSDIQFSGIGGKKMQKAGVNLIQDLSKLNVMGFTEVFFHIYTLIKIFRQMERHLRETKPDLLILVDYPGFNLRLVKSAKAMGIKVLYYISPQIWAWKPGRIKTIQENVDVMAVILPFEKKIYDEANVEAYFVGHPLVDTVKTNLSDKEVREKWKLPLDKKIIGLLPGSRQGEIRRVFPVMLGAAELLSELDPELVFVLPIAPTLSAADLLPYMKDIKVKIHFISSDHYDVEKTCHSLMITSGTATLEAACLGKPMVIVYKTSFLNYFIAMRLALVKYIGLSNLLANKMLVPEIIQSDLTPENLFAAMRRFLDDPQYYHSVEEQLSAVREILKKDASDKSLAEVIIQTLGLPEKN